MPDSHDLRQMVEDLVARVGAIEKRIGMPQEPATHLVVSPKLAAAEPVAERVEEIPALEPVAPPVAAGTDDRRAEEFARWKTAVRAAGRTDVVAPELSAPPESAPSAPVLFAETWAAIKRDEQDAARMERWLGGRLVAVLGSLFLAIGLGLLVKYGVDHSWFTISPAYRCAGVGLLGAMLIGTGEVVRKRLGAAGDIAASGIAASGLAAIYGAALAGYGMYDLYGAAGAFGLLALISAGGIGLALRSDSLPMAVLSLVGAYLNPLFLWRAHGSALVLPTYLIALMVVGLVLAGWRPRPFRWLRGVSWWGTVIIGSLWMVWSGREHPFVVLPFLGVCWLLVHAELYLGARRLPESAQTRPDSRAPSAREMLPMLSSLGATIWTVGSGILVVQAADPALHLEGWFISAAGMIGTLVLALMLAGHLRAFRDPPETDAERLGVVMWTQAGALLATTIALGLSDTAQAVAWLAVGLAAVSAGRWAKARALDGYGVVLLGTAMVRLVVWDSTRFAGIPSPSLGLLFDGWTLLMALGGASWLGAAALVHRPSGALPGPSVRRAAVVNVCLAVGLTLPFVGMVHLDDRAVALAVVGGVWAAVLLGAATVRRSRLLRTLGLIALGGVSAASILVQLSAQGLSHWGVAIQGIVLTDWTFVLIGLGGIWAFGAWILRSVERRPADLARGWKGAIALSAVAVVMVLLSLLTAGRSDGAVAVVWSVMAVGLVAAHTRVRALALDVMGLVVLALAGTLWVLAYMVESWWLDVAAAPLAHPGLRVVLVIAAAMLASAWWLARGTPRRATWMAGVLASVVLAGVLLFAGTSLEVARSAGMWLPLDHTAQAAALTIWWGVFAVTLLVIGFATWTPLVRHAGLGLLGVAAGKVVIFDLAEAAPEWRMASFIALGVLMLGVAVGYAKLSARLDRRERATGAME